jgi:hypothetical protein
MSPLPALVVDDGMPTEYFMPSIGEYVAREANAVGTADGYDQVQLRDIATNQSKEECAYNRAPQSRQDD